MPPKTVFTREQIIDTAFEIFREEGIESLSVRKLAARLNSSTAPIYTSFSNIEEIKQQLLEHSLDLLTGYTEKEYTEDIFLNIGIGLLEFAIEYKTVYRKLFMEDNSYLYILKRFNERNLERMKKTEYLKKFSVEDLTDMLDMMSTYTHGLASMICAGMLENTGIDHLRKKMGETGECVIGAFAYKRGFLDDVMKNEIRRGCDV